MSALVQRSSDRRGAAGRTRQFVYAVTLSVVALTLSVIRLVVLGQFRPYVFLRGMVYVEVCSVAPTFLVVLFT